jgi:pyridoxal 5'-phosphate synthase pdxS subunit
MCEPQLIKEIKHAVTIPVMAKAHIGSFAEVLEAIGVDYVSDPVRVVELRVSPHIEFDCE